MGEHTQNSTAGRVRKPRANGPDIEAVLAPPHSIEAEHAVLGGLLLDNAALDRIGELADDDFYRHDHKLIFSAITRLIRGGRPADAVTVFTSLKADGKADDAGGLGYMNALAQNTPSAANIEGYARIVKTKARERRLLVAMDEAARALATGKAISESSLQKVLDEPQSGERYPVTLDLRELAQTDPQPPPFIIPGWLPEGEVTLFSSHGGAGKSYIALYLAICIALGVPFFGLPVQRRRVTFLSCEDGLKILHWRFSRICRWIDVDMASLAGWLTVLDQSRGDGALMEETREGLLHTPLHAWLRRRLGSAQVLIVDGASDTFDGDEVKRRQVRRFVRELRRMVPEDGAVLLLAHVNATTARNPETEQAFSGSTAWHNSVRARWYLRPDGDGLLLETQKGNHSGDGQSMKLRWNESAHLFVAELSMPVGRLDRELAKAYERDAVLELVRSADAAGDPIPTSKRGDRTAHEVATARGGLPASLTGKRGKAAFYEHLEALRAAGRIVPDGLARPNRHKVEVYRAAPATERAPAMDRSAPATEHAAPATEL